MTTTINADNGAVSGSAGLKSSADATGVLALQTNGTTAISIDASQAVTMAGRTSNPTTISVGAATPSTSGAGITFPATQSASTNANTLDDYEEGTWTATITTSGGSVTIGSQTCTYTKVGRLVVLNGTITLSAISSPTSQFTITNLPFAPLINGGGGATCFLQNINVTAATSLYVELDTTPRIYIGKSITLNSITDTSDLLTATTLIRFGASYST